MNAVDVVCWNEKQSGVKVHRFINADAKGQVMYHGRLKWGRCQCRYGATDG